MIGQAPHLHRKTRGRRRMQIERMVGGIAGDNHRLDAEGHRAVDRRREAAVGFGERPAAVVQVGEVRDADHGALPTAAARRLTATLSR